MSKPYRNPHQEPSLCPNCDRVSSPDSRIGLCPDCFRVTYQDGRRVVEAKQATALANKRERHALKVEPGQMAAGRPGWVYFFLRDDGLIKIGWSQNVEQRIKKHGPGALVATMPGTLATEHAVHRRFEDERIDKSECFAPSPELRAFIADLAAEAA